MWSLQPYKESPTLTADISVLSNWLQSPHSDTINMNSSETVCGAGAAVNWADWDRRLVSSVSGQPCTVHHNDRRTANVNEGRLINMFLLPAVCLGIKPDSFILPSCFILKGFLLMWHHSSCRSVIVCPALISFTCSFQTWPSWSRVGLVLLTSCCFLFPLSCSVLFFWTLPGCCTLGFLSAPHWILLVCFGLVFGFDPRLPLTCEFAFI